MKIKKVCTYENVQLVNLDGSRPRGEKSRLTKTFTDAQYNITFAPHGIGVIIQGKEGDDMSTFVIPFANIPYVVCDTSEESNDSRNSAKEKATPASKGA